MIRNIISPGPNQQGVNYTYAYAEIPNQITDPDMNNLRGRTQDELGLENIVITIVPNRPGEAYRDEWTFDYQGNGYRVAVIQANPPVGSPNPYGGSVLQVNRIRSPPSAPLRPTRSLEQELFESHGIVESTTPAQAYGPMSPAEIYRLSDRIQEIFIQTTRTPII